MKEFADQEQLSRLFAETFWFVVHSIGYVPCRWRGPDMLTAQYLVEGWLLSPRVTHRDISQLAYTKVESVSYVAHWCSFFQYNLAFITMVVHFYLLLSTRNYKYHLIWSVLQSVTAASYLGQLAHFLNSATGGYCVFCHHHMVFIKRGGNVISSLLHFEMGSQLNFWVLQIVQRSHINCLWIILVLRALVGYEQE